MYGICIEIYTMYIFFSFWHLAKAGARHDVRSQYGNTTMLLKPRVSTKWNHAVARNKAGFEAKPSVRVASSIFRPPSMNWPASSLSKLAGNNPTAEKIDVRPPTQSQSGNDANHGSG